VFPTLRPRLFVPLLKVAFADSRRRGSPEGFLLARPKSGDRDGDDGELFLRGGCSRRLTLACGPPRIGVHSAAPQVGCEASFPSPPGCTSVVPRPGTLSCPRRDLAEKRRPKRGATSGNERVAPETPTLRPALWTACWVSGATCRPVSFLEGPAEEGAGGPRMEQDGRGPANT